MHTAHTNTFTAKKKLQGTFFVCKLSFFFSVVVGFFLFFPTIQVFATEVAQNGSWQATLVPHPVLPPHLVAVDKNKQELYVYATQQEFSLLHQYTCTTGQSLGDKQVQGDRKTPEGIYFVVKHLSSGLDFSEYGHEAYTLNYPNPVDKLRNKTGYGIWIHGKGETIRPLITRGCVALNNEDLETLGNLLKPGSPVALTSSFSTSTNATEYLEQSTQLKQKVKAWAKAWASRSSAFFTFYDSQSYELAQGSSFAAFKRQKEQLFTVLPWIETTAYNVQVLEGPGYWVTWFDQLYAAPNLKTYGVRRLYWQKNDAGEFVIVGMEWLPHETTGFPILPEEPLEPQERLAAASTQAAPALVHSQPEPLVASLDEETAFLAAHETSILAFIESWRTTWEQGNLDEYCSYYTDDVVQGVRRGKSSIKAHKESLWRRAAPQTITLSNIRLALQGKTVIATMSQQYTSGKNQSDYGIKSLELLSVDDSWIIINEQWRPAKQ